MRERAIDHIEESSATKTPGSYPTDPGHDDPPGGPHDLVARRLLRARVWPEPSAAALARSAQPDRLATPRQSIWRSAAPARLALALSTAAIVAALALHVQGELAPRAHAIASTVRAWLVPPGSDAAPAGWLVCVDDTPDLAVAMIDVATGMRLPLGGTFAGRGPRHRDSLAQLAPSGDAIAVRDIDPDDGDVARYHFDLDIRQLESWTPPDRAIRSEGDRFATAFVWGPDGRSFLYQVDEAAPEPSSDANARALDGEPGEVHGRPAGRAAAFELRMARLGTALGDPVLRVREDTPVLRVVDAGLPPDGAALVGWDPSSNRAVVAVRGIAKSRLDGLGGPGYGRASTGNALVVVDLRRRQIVATVDVGKRVGIQPPSPDGRYVAFRGCPTCSTTRSEVGLLDIAAGRARTVAKVPTGYDAFGLTWSPDSRWLAWHERQVLPGTNLLSFPVRAQRIDRGARSTPITVSAGEPAAGQNGLPPVLVAFAPDSASVLVARGRSRRVESTMVHRLGGRAGSAIALPPDPGQCVGWIERGRDFERLLVAWPPDASTLEPWASGLFPSAMFADHAQVVESRWITADDAAARDGFDAPPGAAIGGALWIAHVDVWQRCPVCALRGPPKPPSERHAVAIWRDGRDGAVMRMTRLVTRFDTPEPGSGVELPREAAGWGEAERIGVAVGGR